MFYVSIFLGYIERTYLLRNHGPFFSLIFIGVNYLLIVIFLSTELYALLVSLFKHVITVCL